MTEEGGWNWDMINNIFWEVDQDEIKRIPIGYRNRDDRLLWQYTPKGEYSVKSGYCLAHESEETGSNGLRCGLMRCLKKLWNLKLPNKIKIHLWRALFNALPVRQNLQVRRIIVNTSCPQCQTEPETIPHSFWYCKMAKKIWKKTDLWPMLKNFRGGNFVDLFDWVVDHDQGNDLAMFVLIVWSSWIERNKVLYDAKTPSHEDVLARADRIVESYKLIFHHHVAAGPSQISLNTWKPPTEGVIKVNVDAAVNASLDMFSVGLVGRNSNGHVLFAIGCCFPGRFTPHIAELIAVKEGVLKAIQLGWTK